MRRDPARARRRAAAAQQRAEVQAAERLLAAAFEARTPPWPPPRPSRTNQALVRVVPAVTPPRPWRPRRYHAPLPAVLRRFFIPPRRPDLMPPPAPKPTPPPPAALDLATEVRRLRRVHVAAAILASEQHFGDLLPKALTVLRAELEEDARA